MATKTYTLSFASLGADLDNFTLASNGGPVTPNAATRAQLLAGLTFSVSSAATVLTLVSSGWCSNAFNVPLPIGDTSGTPPPDPEPTPTNWGTCYQVTVENDQFLIEGSNWTMTVKRENNTFFTAGLEQYDAIDLGNATFMIPVCSKELPEFRFQGVASVPPGWVTIVTGGACSSDLNCSTPL
jgi:hypothetical protein